MSEFLYYRTKKGLITRILKNQKTLSKKRGLPPPLYTKDQLSVFLLNSKIFNELFYIWEINNYSKLLVPSLDRLDDYRGYSFDNIQILTWQENKNKGHKDRILGINNKHSKKVYQYNKDSSFITSYVSVNAASRYTGIDVGNISKCCSKERKSAGGYIWRYEYKD